MLTLKELILKKHKVSISEIEQLNDLMEDIESSFEGYIPCKATLEIFDIFSKDERYIEGICAFCFKGQEIIVKDYNNRLKGSEYYHDKQLRIKLKIIERSGKGGFDKNLYRTICRMFLARKREAYAKENGLKY